MCHTKFQLITQIKEQYDDKMTVDSYSSLKMILLWHSKLPKNLTSLILHCVNCLKRFVSRVANYIEGEREVEFFGSLL